jgi:carboxylesterase
MTDHSEFIRYTENCSTAVLMIHGIVGSPAHFKNLIDVIPEDMTLHNILLDGHGKGVSNFGRSSMKKWKKQVSGEINALLQTHCKVFIVAHSMGTLFAIDRAIENEAVKGLFLLAVPLVISPKPRMVSNLCKVYFDKIKPDDVVALAAKRCYGIAQDKNPFHYFGWIPRYLELFAKAKETRRKMQLLQTPCVIYQSAKDELVSHKSAQRLAKNEKILVVELKNSGH